jgi:transposase-like protein
MAPQVVYEDHRIQATRTGEYLRLWYKQPHVIRIKVGDRQAVDDEVIHMLRMRTASGQKYLLQKQAGAIIGVSRQMVNRRWQVYRSQGLLVLLAREWERSKITPELLERLAEICVDNPFLSAEAIRDQLRAEGLCQKISGRSIYLAQRMMDGRKLILLMRERSARRVPGAFMEAGYMIKRLFAIIEDLLVKVPQEVIAGGVKRGLESLQGYFAQSGAASRGPTEKDLYSPRKKLQRDRRRNVGFLQRMLAGLCGLVCPDCHSRQIRFIFKRARGHVDGRGKRHRSYSRIYRCCNPRCRTRYFTVPPKGVELYARFHTAVKKMALRWVFHLRGSLSRVRDELGEHGIHVHLTTVLRWVKKAGEECVSSLQLQGESDWQQPLCIDEKWIKVRDRWHYVFTAVGTKVTDLLAIDLFYHRSKEAMKTFLLSLKSAGFRPEAIITDLLMGYESVVKDVFPDARYRQCVLHAERDAKRLVRKALLEEAHRPWKSKLIRAIRVLFKSKKLRQVKRRYWRIIRWRGKAPQEVEGVFQMLETYYPKLCDAVARADLPRTTNPAERAIGEFEERYHVSKAFTSFYHAQFFIKAYQIYYRLRKISFGRFRGRCRLELKGSPLGRLAFTDYLTPTLT